MSWTLYVHTAVGKTSTVSVEPHDTVAALKSKIHSQTNVPKGLQQLLFQGRKLDDDEATLLSYSIHNWAKILLLPQKAEQKVEQKVEPGSCDISIKTLSGKSFSVQVKPGDTVEDVCGKIAKKENIPLEQQQLIHGGRVLDLDSTLDQYGIQQGSALHIVSALSQRKLLLRVPKSPWTKPCTVPVAVLLTENTSNLYKKVTEKFKIPMECLQINLKGKSIEKGKPLSHYSIESGSVVDIEVLDAVEKQVLFVKTPTGQMVKVEYLPGDSIASIKNKVHTTTGIKPINQILMSAGRPLEDALTTNSYNLANETTLHLLMRSKSKDVAVESSDLMDIFIRALSGKMFSIRVSLSDTVGDIKAKIQATKGLACSNQTLLLKGTPLDDSTVLKDCNIETESTFCLALMPSPPAGNDMRILVKVSEPAEKTLELQVSGSSMVKELKQKISASERISVDHQRLLLGSVELSDGDLLSRYHLQTNTLLLLQVVSSSPRRSLYVRNLLGKITEVEVFPNDSVKTLKTRISAKEGIPPDNQRLIFCGKDLRNEELIESYNIEQESNIQLALTVPESQEELTRVFVRTLMGKILTVEVPTTAKVRDLKQKVYSLEGILPGQQKIILDGTELDDEARLETYHINVHTTLQLVISAAEEDTSRNIFVTTPLGKVVTLSVTLEETVREVKEKIRRKEGIPLAQQKLLFRGRELEDNKPLADYTIERESHLVMVQSMDTTGTVSVRMPSGDVLPVGLQPGDTVATIKGVIQQLRGEPVGRQDILGQDLVALQDSAVVSPGDKLVLAPMPVSVSVVVSRYSSNARLRTLAVDGVRTIGNIRQFVVTSLGIAPGNGLKLFCNGKMLTEDNYHTLEPGDVIMLGKWSSVHER